jgi:hypothetical protein
MREIFLKLRIFAKQAFEGLAHNVSRGCMDEVGIAHKPELQILRDAELKGFILELNARRFENGHAMSPYYY